MNHLPDLDPALGKILGALGAVIDLDTRGILVVAASAHGRAVASVRDLEPVSTRVHIGGHDRRWELALRPRFWSTGDGLSRLTTLAHELLHLDKTGGLLAAHRHASLSKEALDTRARTVVEQAAIEPLTVAPLGHHGWARLRQWSRRPLEDGRLDHYTDDDLMTAVVEVTTPAALRTTWW